MKLYENALYQVIPNDYNINLIGVPLKLVGFKNKFNPLDKEIQKVCFFNQTIEGDYNFDLSFWENSIQPIILTEEWLIKFKFTKKIDKELNYRYFKKGICYLSIFGKDYPFRLRYAPIPNNGFKYVHQLQNIYFALEEEELTL